MSHAWASAVAPGWQAAVVRAGDKWLAVAPFWPRQKWGLKYLTQPDFCQHWGVCFAPLPVDAYARFQSQKEILDTLLPFWEPWRLYRQNFSPAFDYPLPFHWRGYTLQTRYTYRLSLSPEPASLLAACSAHTRRHLRKGESLTIRPSSTDALLSLIQANLDAGKPLMGHIRDWAPKLRRLLEAPHTNARILLLEACDPEGRIQAAGAWTCFGGTATYLTGARQPGQASSALHALMWQAMLQCRALGCTVFDFEGSMLEGVEAFFRGFGSQPAPYLFISRNRLPLWIRWIRGST